MATCCVTLDWSLAGASCRIRPKGLLTPAYLASVEGEDDAVDQKHETNKGACGSDPTEITTEELAWLRFFEGVPGWALERLARSAAKFESSSGRRS